MGSFCILLFLTIAQFLVHEGESLKCLFCNTMEENSPGCSDPSLESIDVSQDYPFIKNCQSQFWRMPQFLPNGTTLTQIVNPGMEFVCLKLTGKNLGKNMTVRTCALSDPKITGRSCVQSVQNSSVHELYGGTIETCDTCLGDLCNGAVSVGTTSVLMAPLLLLLKNVFSFYF